MFYNSESMKNLPLEIKTLLTARGLAYWIMDDGYKSPNVFYICTESYSLNENLKQILKTKFNLEKLKCCGIHKHTNGLRLYIFSSSKDILLELIRPYLISHFIINLILKIINK